MIALSKAKKGEQYKIENLKALKSLSHRMAILGLNVGAFIELMALYKHGAVIKTPFGTLALGSDVLDSILVSLV